MVVEDQMNPQVEPELEMILLQVQPKVQMVELQEDLHLQVVVAVVVLWLQEAMEVVQGQDTEVQVDLVEVFQQQLLVQQMDNKIQQQDPQLLEHLMGLDILLEEDTVVLYLDV